MKIKTIKIPYVSTLSEAIDLGLAREKTSTCGEYCGCIAVKAFAMEGRELTVYNWGEKIIMPALNEFGHKQRKKRGLRHLKNLLCDVLKNPETGIYDV